MVIVTNASDLGIDLVTFRRPMLSKGSLTFISWKGITIGEKNLEKFKVLERVRVFIWQTTHVIII